MARVTLYFPSFSLSFIYNCLIINGFVLYFAPELPHLFYDLHDLAAVTLQLPIVIYQILYLSIFFPLFTNIEIHNILFTQVSLLFSIS